MDSEIEIGPTTEDDSGFGSEVEGTGCSSSWETVTLGESAVYSKPQDSDVQGLGGQRNRNSRKDPESPCGKLGRFFDYRSKSLNWNTPPPGTAQTQFRVWSCRLQIVATLNDWNRLSRMPPERLAAHGRQRLEVFVRSELWPYCPGVRARLQRAQQDGRRFRADQLPSIASLSMADMSQSSAALDHWIHPSQQTAGPGSGKAAGSKLPAGRRWANRLVGKRAQVMLDYAYCNSRSFTVAEVTWRHSPQDVQMAAESAARALGLLGFEQPGRALLWVDDSSSDHCSAFAAFAVGQGALQLGLHLCGPELLASARPHASPEMWIGSAHGLGAAARKALALPSLAQQLKVIVLTGWQAPGSDLQSLEQALSVLKLPNLRRARLLAHPATRMTWVTPLAKQAFEADVSEANSGNWPQQFALYPDLGLTERDDETEELVHSNSAGHGTACFRLRLGWKASELQAAPGRSFRGLPSFAAKF